MTQDERYMARALQLARAGEGFASPNPMVGAVVTASDGRIIGEGYHRRWGGPHAEVNAIASVRPEDRHLLREATIYVTLEPCSHYGKTPPCSGLIIKTGIPHVVIGAGDPFPQVAGRGVRMLREAGVEVTEGVLADECRALNRRFMTAHTLGRPYIQLKWAQSSDGFMATGSPEAPRPVPLSTPLTLMWMHRERAKADAILVGTTTVAADDPSLTTRLWPGSDSLPDRETLKVSFASPRIPAGAKILAGKHLLLDPRLTLPEQMETLYHDHGVTSLMVEGGAETLRRFMAAGLWDEMRVETSPKVLRPGVAAPAIPAGTRHVSSTATDGNLIDLWMPGEGPETHF